MGKRMDFRKRLASAAMVAFVGLSGPVHAEQVTLTFANWATAEGATRDGMEKVISAFEAENPDIKIESESIAFAEMARQLVLRLRSGNPPDIAQVAGNDTFALALTKGLEPLQGYADAEFLGTLTPGAYEPLMMGEDLIAFPWNQAPAGLWYNKKLMADAGLDPENPPKTIDELNSAMAAIKEANPQVIVLGIDTTNRAFALQSNWPWIRAFGADPVAEGGAEGDEMQAYLGWLRDISEKGYVDPGRKIGEFRPLFAQDQVAFLWDQVLVQGVIQSTNGMSAEEFNQNYGVIPMPTGPGGKGYSFDGGHQLVMFGDSEHKEAAWKFMEYLGTNEAAIRTYTIETNRSIPPVKSIEDPAVAELLDTPVIETFKNDIIPTISPMPFGPEFAEYATVIMAGIQEAVTSDRPVADIAAEIQNQIGN
ncbi:extracellular solute-binding protein [Paracoccus onubensis]|uniref:extracellular solute-binding protein n=1 Tax=Paracoccus onubensis TaxID=1675788 RepID=UPI002730F5B1|nr:extracellular solute-binding protein [Paracoccus onubensis]MDP0926272.1 extracellular solute-binding protein [Paracoccus onubensis]